MSRETIKDEEDLNVDWADLKNMISHAIAISQVNKTEELRQLIDSYLMKKTGLRYELIKKIDSVSLKEWITYTEKDYELGLYILKNIPDKIIDMFDKISIRKRAGYMTVELIKKEGETYIILTLEVNQNSKKINDITISLEGEEYASHIDLKYENFDDGLMRYLIEKLSSIEDSLEDSLEDA